MTPMEKEYKEKYNNIPNTQEERINYLINSCKLNRQKQKTTDIINNNIDIKWEKISYTIYLVPKGTPRPRMGMSGVFYVKGAKDHKKVFNTFWKEVGGLCQNMIVTQTKFNCKTYQPTPSSMSGSEKIAAELGFVRPIVDPDWDNMAKTYCDMIQDTLLYNDCLIIDGELHKYYSIKPRIEVEIEYMKGFDCKYNQTKILKKLEKAGVEYDKYF